MAFEDSLIGNGEDFDPHVALDSLIRKESSEPLPGGSLDPRMLNTRLAMKLNQPTPKGPAVTGFEKEPDFGEPDFSSQAVEPAEAVSTTADFSDQATEPPMIGPAAPAQPPLTISRQAKAALKGIPHGAIEHAGGIMQGAAAVYDKGAPGSAAAPEYDALGNAIGTQSAPTEGTGPMPLQERDLYKAGKSVKDFAQAVVPMDDQEKDSIGGRVGTGAGAIAPYVAATFLAGPMAGLGAAAAGMATDTYGHIYEEAKKHGADEATASRVALDAAGIAGVLGSLPIGAGKLAKGLLAKMATSGIAFSGAGEMEEYLLQQIAKTYDPKAGYTVDEKRIIASLILGAGVGGMHHAFERGPQQQPPPGPPPGAAPGPSPTGLPPGAGPSTGPGPGSGGPHPGGAGPQPGAGTPPPGGGAGPQPGGPGQQQGPGRPPPGSGPDPARAAKGDEFTFHSADHKYGGPQERKTAENEYVKATGKNPANLSDGELFGQLRRAKFERILRTIDPKSDPSKLSDGDLYNTVNDQMSAQAGAKPETAEEAKVREDAAKRRDEDDVLRKAGWTEGHIRAMTPEQRADYVARASGKAQAEPKAEPKAEPQAAKPEAAPTSDPDVGPTMDTGQNAPESRATLKAQQNQLIKGERSAQMFPKGTREMPLPPGMERVETDRGIFHFNPKKTTAAKITEASAAGRENDVLDLGPFSKADILARAGEKPVTVVERMPDGTEVRAAVGTEGTVAEQLAAMEKAKSPGNTVAVETLEQTLESRKPKGTRDEPVDIKTADDVVRAASAGATDYTPAQGEANNRKLGHAKWNGLPVSLEVAKGGSRKMLNPETGEPVEVTHGGAAYGYIPGTMGADGMHVDIYMGDHPESPNVYVIDEVDSATGKFRQHKVMGGFPSERDAFTAYVGTSTKSPETVGAISAMSVPDLKAWLAGDTTKALKLASGEPVKAPEASSAFTETPPTDGAPKETPTAAGAAGGRSDGIMPDAADSSVRFPTDAKNKQGPKSLDTPLTLLQFIASRGGLRPDPELAALDIGNHRVQIPGRKGFFGVIKQDGERLDMMREAAEEAGYLRGEHNKTSTVRDLLDAIDEERNRGGRVMAEGDELAKSKRQRELDAEREEHERERHEIEYGAATRELIESGYVELYSDLHEAAVRLMVEEHMTPDDAVETAALRLVATDRDYGVTEDAIKDTFGGGAYDEARAGAASGNGERSPREREAGARPGEGQEDRSDGADLPRAGAQGREAEAADNAARAEVAIETALGPDADLVAPVDIARAAEIMADNPDMDPATAFGQAVVVNAVEQGFITKQEAETAYGPEVNEALEAERARASRGSEDDLGEIAETSEAGGRDAAEAGVVSRGRKTRGKAARDDDGAAAVASDTAEQSATSREQTAGDQAGDAAQDGAAAAAADNAGRLKKATAPEHTHNKGKPLDRGRLYPKVETGASKIKADIDEGIVPLTMDKEQFKEITDEWAALFEDPDQRVNLETRHKNGPFIPLEEAQKRVDAWRERARAQGDGPEMQANSEKTVLSLFDLTGEWARPWAEAGYNVITFDIQKGQDVHDFSVEYFNENYDFGEVYAIIAACPCTDFAVSGAKHFAAKDADGRTEASKELVFKTLQTIEYFRPKIWALENPVGRIESLTGLPKWRLLFNPNNFGAPYTKKTILWGNFDAELPTANVEPVEGSKMWSQYGGKSQATKNARSETPEGFAYAFFAANNAADMPVERRLTLEYPEASGAVKAALDAGVTEERIAELMEFTYGNYEYEAARNALVREAAGLPQEDRAEVQAADSDETVTVTLSREGPWDFNDTFPAPDPEKFAALEKEGRAPFESPSDAAEVSDAVDAGVYDMISDMAIIRAADATIADIRAGKIKLKKKESVVDRIAALTKTRNETAESLRGHMGTFEDVFGRAAARAMMKEARKRIVQEDGQRDKGVDRKAPAKDVDDDAEAEADRKYYNSPMQPELSFEDADHSTLLHYAKGMGFDGTKGSSREQLIEALLAKGARGYQGGGIIAVPKSPAGAIEALQNSAEVPDVLFAKFKAALAAHPEKMESRAYAFETEPNGDTWKWEVRDGKALMQFTAYGANHVYIGSTSLDGSGFTDSKKQAADFMKKFVKDHPLAAGTKLVKPKAAKSVDDLTPTQRKAERDAPTWAEILAELPMHKDGRTREHEIAFAAITEMTGKKKPKYNDLTPAQKHELLAKMKAREPAPAADPFDDIFDEAVNEQFARPEGSATREHRPDSSITSPADKNGRPLKVGDRVSATSVGGQRYEATIKSFHVSPTDTDQAEIASSTPAVDKKGKPYTAHFVARPDLSDLVKIEAGPTKTTGLPKVEDTPVETFPSDHGMESRIYDRADGKGYSVILFDADANKPVPGISLHPTLKAAQESARKLAIPLGPNVPPAVEKGADNKPQLVMPGAEKASDGTMAKRAAAAPLKPKVAQKGSDFGLFGDERNQTDLMDMLARPAPREKAPDLSIDDVAAGLNSLFGKGLSDTDVTFVDEAKYQQALPFFKAGVAHFAAGGADLPVMVRALVKHLAGAGMDAEAIRAMKPYIKRFTDDVTAGRETINAPSRSDVLEPNRGEPEARDTVGEADVPAAAGATGQGPGERGSAADAGDQRSGGGERLPESHAPVMGADGNLELPAREPVVEDRDAADRQRRGSNPDSEGGFSFDDGTTDEAIRAAQQNADLNERRQRQQAADRKKIPFKWGRLDNIAESLPMLFPEQHADVQAAEIRFNKTDGHGMLFTNGTGTGKTYSGGGVIKRFFQQGKSNVIVIAPSQGILADWQRSMRDLGLDMHILDSTADKGRGGLNGTTYANFGDNPTLADRDWDLVVPDEAHKLSSDQDGTATKALQTLRALTKHPDGLQRRAEMVLRALWNEVKPLPEKPSPAQQALHSIALKKFYAAAEPLIAKWKDEQRPKALMMSATPFAYHFSLDYAQGYLFEFPKDSNSGAYNAPTGRDSFYMQHLGYRKRTGKLTKPDADVKSEIMERQLHEHLKKTGSLSGRALTVDKDYDRKFVLAHNAAGELIDRALNFLQEAEGGRYRPLHDVISKQFDYLARMRLLEAMKAQDAIEYIKESHALGRKVVVFHDYNEGGGISPFTHRPPTGVKVTSYVDGKHVEVELSKLYDDFAAQNPYIKELDFAAYPAPIYTLSQAFPDALIYNGNVPNKKRAENKRLFNDDNSGRDLIVIQSAAGEAGISLHDTTGKKQRVLLNLGMPIRPTTSIQQEGRIYRVGQASDAMFRYMNTGTDWERWTFAGKIADRAGTAENLALGDLARTIRQSFIDAFSNAGDYRPEAGEGKGGKDIDRATTESMSEFTKAKTHYFAQAKVSGRRDQREGIDYYATPEPIGLKMVEFAGLKPGEKILEPSAGHGAIARYFPEDSARTLVEPSSSLASRAALTSPGARVVVDRFENLDTGANKFDAIVMNPPFGSGGSTAIEHVAKAVKHLKNGGRIVALIPRGPAADAKLEKFIYGDAAKGIYIAGNILLPQVTFSRAGAGVMTRIIVLEKQTDEKTWVEEKNFNYSDAETINDLFDRIEHAEMPARQEPKTKDVDAPTNGKLTIDGIELSLVQERDGTPYAYLQNKIGIDKFKRVMRAVEANDGYYLKAAKAARFKTVEGRQKFLDALASEPATPEPPSAPSGVTFKVAETKHAKTGDDLFVASPDQRVERDVYNQMAAAAKTHGGWYSSFKLRGAIPGFQFKSADARTAFLKQMGGGLGESPASSLAGARGQLWTLDEGRKDGNEHLIAYTADGSVISRSDGIAKFVAFTPELIKELLNPANDIVAHHNHPSSSSLSQTDLMSLAYPGLTAVWAHGHNGNIYRAALTPEAKQEFARYGALPVEVSKRIQDLYTHVKWRLHTPMQEAFSRGAITIDEANGGINHLINEVLAEAGVIDYRSNYQLGDLVLRVPSLNDTIKNAVIAARKEAFDGKAAGDGTDRRAGPLRHAGDLGATFDRAAVATRVRSEGRRDPVGEENDFVEGPGLAQPDNTFKKQGSHDVSLGEVMRTRLLGRLGELNATEARTQLQDKFARIKNAEESVGAVPSSGAYQAESLYYGRTGQRLESLNEHHIDPIIREMRARDIELDKLDEFLAASHAPERNDKIGAMYPPGHQFHDAINDHDIVGGSGWSKNEALGVIRAARAAGKLQDYLTVARMVWTLNYNTRRKLYDAGLIDRDTLDAWNAVYKYYTPQRGTAEGDQWMGAPSGVNVRGKEAKTAFGRRSKADSPLAYSIMQAELAIVRSEKNKVGNTFLQFVRAHPDPARWTVDRPPLVKRIDPATGLVTTMPDSLYANRDDVFTTKINGKDVHVTMHGPDGLNLARALKNMGTANVHPLIRTYSTLTHTMARLATAWNPEFMIPNFIRDLGEAFINLSEQQQRDFVRNFVKHLPGAMKGSMQALAGGGGNHPPGSPPRRYIDAFHEFDAAGGRIRFFGIDDPDQIEGNVGRKLARLKSSAVNTLKDIGDKAAKGLEIAGGGIENATRLAAYMAAREAGMSIPESAMLARRLTVDFNKSGELGGAISALYMFAKAGINGQARMIQALGHRRVWQAVGALAAAAALSALFSILAGGEDDAGVSNYMKVPPWERDKNLIFMLPNGTYIKVPLPYGFSPFAVLGARTVATMMGHDKPGKAAHAVMDSILSAFNPLGEESTMLMDVVPSAIRPAFHIWSNKNWTGKPLYPEQDERRGQRPDSVQGFNSDSIFSKTAAKLLNEWSGGTNYKRGYIDVHPGSIDHALQAIGGGAGRFVKGIADNIGTAIKGDEWQPDKIPVLRRFVGKIGPQHDAAAFYELRKEARDAAANTAAARRDNKAGINVDQARDVIDNASVQTRQGWIFKNADAQMKPKREELAKIQASDRLTDEQRTRAEALKQEMRAIQNQARREYQKTKEGQGASQ